MDLSEHHISYREYIILKINLKKEIAQVKLDKWKQQWCGYPELKKTANGF